MDNRVWVKDAVMTIRLPEEVDHFVADRLREEAGEILVERNVREVVFDFRKTVFMDSSGIGLVMGRFREMELIGGKVRAVHVGERMRRILVMSGVTRVDLRATSVTWLMAMPGEISTNKAAWPAMGRNPRATVARNEANCGCRLSMNT